MKVYALSGKSGTGKSYQALNLCRKLNIEGIIDDGLFIYNNAIQAGHSAKRDDNKITAIRTAIFDKEEDRRAVADKIKEVAPESILLIGTSDGMVRKIAARLEIPEPDPIIYIEDIVDQEAIDIALHQRREAGKHVIPVPTVEVRSQFSGYFLTPLRMFFDRAGRSMPEDEKTVVRPTYSYLGKFSIAPGVVTDIMEHTAEAHEGIYEVLRCSSDIEPDGVKLNVSAIFNYRTDLLKVIEDLQEKLAKEVAHMTAFNILSVNVIVRGLRPPRRKTPVRADAL